MTTVTRAPLAPEVSPGSHVCWVVADDSAYIAAAAAILRAAPALREKPMAFGPHESPALEALSGLAAQVADPRVAFLGGGGLDPDTMFAMFREQSALARDEGYDRLRLVADMDWLLPAHPTRHEVLAFELLLDRHAKELDATIVCAYRTSTFGSDILDGALCVHPVNIGCSEEPAFQLVAGEGAGWRLSGEVDLGLVPNFESALRTAAAASHAASGSATCELDASELSFIDVSGMRTIGEVSRSAGVPIRVLGARPIVRRCWELARFDELAPLVAFTG